MAHNSRSTCRLCMYKNGPDEVSKWIPIFAQPKLAARITYVTDLKVEKNDGLPSVICQRCNIRVKSAESFKKQSHTSDQQLRQEISPEDSIIIEPVYFYMDIESKPLDGEPCSEQEIIYAEFDIEPAYSVDIESEPLDHKPSSEQEGRNVDNDSYNHLEKEIQPCKDLRDTEEEDPVYRQMKEENTAEDIVDMLIENGAHCFVKVEIEDSPDEFECETENDPMESDVKYDHECDACSKRFPTPRALIQHKRRIHLDKRPHKCIVCGCTFTRRDHLKRHSMRHDKRSKSVKLMRPPVFCTICNRLFSSSVTLARHHKNVHTDGEHTCPQCDLSFSSFSKLKRHRAIHATRNGPFKCGACGMGFSIALALHAHARSHDKSQELGKEVHQCEVCGRVFVSRHTLATHIRSSHNNERPYVCDICQRTFKAKVKLMEHMSVHTGIKPFLCTYCGMGFRRKCRLNEHHRKHTGEQPYSCSLCLKKFSYSNSLRTHKKLFHERRRSFECDVCSKWFATGAILSRHKRTHTGERPFVCMVCNKTFGRPEHLATHMLLHTGERNYQCEDCRKTFVYKVALVNHYKKSCP